MVAILVCAQTIVAGATVVFGVIFAVEILETGPQGVGVIDSVFGIGAIVGGFYAIARSTKQPARRRPRAGHGRCGRCRCCSSSSTPPPSPCSPSAILLGFGNPLVDVNFATIVQRLTPDAVLGRVFGAYEGALIGTMALGLGRHARSSSAASGCAGHWPSSPSSSGCRPSPSCPGACASTRTLRAARGHRPAARHRDLLPAAPVEIEALARSLTTETASGRRGHRARGRGVGPLPRHRVSGRVEVTQDGEHAAPRGPRRVLRRDRPAARRPAHRHRHGGRGHHASTAWPATTSSTRSAAPTSRSPRPTTSSSAAWADGQRTRCRILRLPCWHGYRTVSEHRDRLS